MMSGGSQPEGSQQDIGGVDFFNPTINHWPYPAYATLRKIEAPHYFQPIFDRLRVEPNDTLPSDLGEHGDPRVGSAAHQ